MDPRAELLMKAIELFERFDRATKSAVAQHVGRLYAGDYFAAIEEEIEARRENDRERQRRHRESRDTSRDTSQTQETIPTLVVDASSSSVSSEEKKASKKQVLTQDDLSKAKGLLAAADFEFLQACPEPFRTEWLIDPEWWVSLRDGYPKVDALREASKNMSWLQGKYSPKQMARMNLRERLRRWIAKSDRWRENAEERKAVRR